MDRNKRLWVLGASDPEMQMIEDLLVAAGEYVAYAADATEKRIRGGMPAETVIPCPRAREWTGDGVDGSTVELILVECSLPPGMEVARSVTRIDHHSPGDPGYGRPPSEFMAASSLGQVLAHLGVAVVYSHRDDSVSVLGGHEGQDGWDYRWSGIGQPTNFQGLPFGPPVCPGANQWTTGKHGIWAAMPTPEALDDALDLIEPREAMIVAAADHCLAAAYRGECRGVDPDELMAWRAKTRAEFQGRPVADVLSDIRRAHVRLLDAYSLAEVPTMRDMRGPVVPELPEAATRMGVGYMSGPLESPDGRRKFTCSGTADEVRAWIKAAPAMGIVDTYGDPARGFAGGYERTGGPS